MNPVLAVLVAVVVCFAMSGAYYAVLASGDDGTPTRSAGATAIVELVRNAVLITGIAVLLERSDLSTVSAALLAGLGLWVAFPLVLLSGSVFHEGTSIARALLHAGDWLLKLLVAAVLLVVLT